MAAAAIPHPPERRLLGVALRAAAATAFAFMAASLKYANVRGVATPEMIFYRNFWALPVVAGWVSLGPGWAAVRPVKPLGHLGRSALGFVSMLLTFGALALLPLAEATTLTYASPILATILSALLLRERVGPRRWAAVLVGFVGVLLVARPGSSGLPLLGLLVGIGAAVGQAGVMITLRTLGRTETIAAIVFWFTLITSIVGAAMLPLFGHAHDGLTYAVLIGAGLFGGIGQLTMTASLRFAPVAVVAPFDYLQIAWGIVLGWLVFAAPAAHTTLLGAAFIAGSGLYTVYRERMRRQVANEALQMPEA